MPGYKVVLRILLIALILGGIGVLIYFLVGGFSNTKTAHNVYANIKESNDYAYVQERLDDSTDIYSVVNGQVADFSKWYDCYKSQTLVFEEFGQTLYFSEKKVGREMSGKVDDFLGDVKNTKNEIEVLKERKTYFEEHGSEDQSQLKVLAEKVANKFYAQTKTLSSLNEMIVDFALKNTLKSEASLKYTMLEIVHTQSKLLLNYIQSEKTEDLNLVLNENKQARSSYLTQKQTNFQNQAIQNTNEFNMMLTFKDIDKSLKQEFLNSSNKQSFINKRSPNQQTIFGYVMKVMGWEA